MPAKQRKQTQNSTTTQKNQKAKAKPSESQPSYILPFFFLVAAVVAAALPQVQPELVQQIGGEPAANKPHRWFSDFYPAYLGEHRDRTCQLLHFTGTCIICIIMAVRPRIAIGMAIAGFLGWAAFPFFRSHPHGIAEAAITFSAFLLSSRSLEGRWKYTLIVPLVGYTFAWVGHFFFEHNKPATFIYPVYSLMGDFRMAFDIATGALPAIWDASAQA